MDPPKDTDRTLCMFMDRFIHKENEGPRAETHHVGHSSIASFGVTCVVTLRERSPPPTSVFSFRKETQCSLGQTGGEHLPADSSHHPLSTWERSAGAGGVQGQLADGLAPWRDVVSS